MALLSLAHANSPPFVLNIAGPEQVSVRRVCIRLGHLMGKEVRFVGCETDVAILSNGQLGHRLFGYPTMGLDELAEYVATWVKGGGELLGKATKFELRDGKF